MCTIAYDADLRYLFTKLGGGTQPYAGRVTTGKTEDGETVFAVSEGWESDLLLPDGQETIVTVN